MGEQHDDAGRERVTDHVTDLWTGVGGFTLALIGAGVAFGLPGVVLAAGAGVALAAAATLAGPPRLLDPDTGEPVLSVDHEFDDPSPDPGDEVTVTVEVRNQGRQLFSDVRFVDGVPDKLEVIDSTPRHAAVLWPGGRTRFTYTVTATRGEFEWNPAAVAVADPTGAVKRETTIDAVTTLECSLPPVTAPGEQLQLRRLTTQYPGRIPTDEGGSGVEFYATREYRSTDPLSRVDWHRLASTGELATVTFREERLARVMVVVDARRAAYRAPAPGKEHAVDRGAAAAHQLLVGLLDAGHQVGLTAFGTDDDCWLSPGSGDEHRTRGRELLSTHPSFSPRPPEREQYTGLHDDRRETLQQRRIERLHRRLLPDTQIVLVSPCCDDHVSVIARRLDAYGHPVTILSPDPTADDTPEHALAQLGRTDRLAALREDGIRVVDWGADESVVEAIAEADARWTA